MSPNRNVRAGRLAALTIVPMLAIVAACGVDTSSSVSGPAAPEPVVVGASDTVESELVARLYAGALEAGGRGTELVLGLGDRADRVAALDANRVALVPDYTGRLLHWFEPDAEALNADDVFEALGKSLPQGLEVADYAPADDRSELVLSAAEAERLGVRSIGDLGFGCADKTLYASDAFREDAGALSRLWQAYWCSFETVVPVGSTDDVVRELGTAASPIGGVTAASPDVAQDGIVVLADDVEAFTAQNVVPLFRSGVLRADDVKALSVVMQLTTADLTDMVVRIRGGETTSADAAGEWLAEHI